MKNKTTLLYAFLPVLALSCLTSCGNNAHYEEEIKRHYEVGETVIEWKSIKNYSEAPIAFVEKNDNNEMEIVKNFGHDDKSSLHFETRGKGSLGTEVLEEPYFSEDHVKNGDIISMYIYVPNDGNIDSIQLEALPNSMENGFKGKKVDIIGDNEDNWVRTLVTYDSIDTLGAIRLNYTPLDESKPSHFYVDDISIVYGEQTVKTGYKYDDESLCDAYEDYMKIGTCMSGYDIQNNMLRTIVRDNFNSITAENEGKPERILDQEACQQAAKKDKTAVKITTAPFEKIYDFAEAHHIGVRHHTFVWFDQTPNWFFTEDYTNDGKLVNRTTMLARMENFIKTALETMNDRWPGLVYAIDVSNESVQNGEVRKKDNYGNNDNKWYVTVGEDFVYWAFYYADKYRDPDQELYYNDYTFDYETSNCEFALNHLLKKAIEEEIIDGVGIQTHLDVSNLSIDAVIKDAELIKEKGLKCQLTEIDMTVNGSGEEAFKTQKAAYKQLAERVLKGNDEETTDVNALVFWGVTDDRSWRRSQNPLMFTSDYAKKPAYYGLMEAIDEFIYG